MPGVVAHAFNSSTLEAGAGGSLGVQGHPGLQSEFQASLDYRETLSQKFPKQNKIKQKNLELSMSLRLASNTQLFCHSLPSVG